MSLGRYILDLSGSDKLADAFCTVVDVPLDAALEPSVGQNIPFLGVLFKVYGAALTIRERMFLKKIARFLHTLRLVSENDKQEFLISLDKNEACEEVGEKLIFLIDRQDDLEKAEMIGVIFQNYVMRVIDRPTFERLAHAITISHLPDLYAFKVDGISPLLSDATGAALLASGLSAMEVEIVTLRVGGSGRGDIRNRYYLSELGNHLRKILSAHYSRSKS